MGLISKWGKVLTTENQCIEIDGRSLENVHDFIFLGSAQFLELMLYHKKNRFSISCLQESRASLEKS